MEKLVRRLNDLCDAQPFHTGWYLKQLGTGETAGRHDQITWVEGGNVFGGDGGRPDPARPADPRARRDPPGGEPLPARGARPLPGAPPVHALSQGWHGREGLDRGRPDRVGAPRVRLSQPGLPWLRPG